MAIKPVNSTHATIELSRVETMLSSVERMAGGDHDHRIEISKERDTCDAIAFAINILADELSYRLEIEEKQNEELKRTQAKLIQTAKMAALGEFSSGIAHEINNPLAIVRMLVDQLMRTVRQRRHPVDDQLLEGLDKIDRNVERMAKTVKHVQDFSRPAESVKSIISFNEVATAVLQLVSEQLKMRNISLDLDLTAKDPRVEANFHGLEHAFLNLISNASDALEARVDATIKISTEADGSRAVFRISDNGGGIPAENIDKIFQPFFTTKPPGRGTGLGLAITYQIVKDHGGEIDCYSSPNTGTTFEIRLPQK